MQVLKVQCLLKILIFLKFLSKILLLEKDVYHDSVIIFIVLSLDRQKLLQQITVWMDISHLKVSRKCSRFLSADYFIMNFGIKSGQE